MAEIRRARPQLCQTHIYTDASGSPRSIGSLLKRVVFIDREWLLGGGSGAQSWFEGLDIVGIPRLDVIFVPWSPTRMVSLPKRSILGWYLLDLAIRLV